MLHPQEPYVDWTQDRKAANSHIVCGSSVCAPLILLPNTLCCPKTYVDVFRGLCLNCGVMVPEL